MPGISQPLDPGAHETQPVAVVGDCFGIAADFDCTQFTDPAVMLDIEAFVTQDGVTWLSVGKSTHIGGKVFDPDGVQLTRIHCEWLGCTVMTNGGKPVCTVANYKNPQAKIVIRVAGGQVLTDFNVAGVKTAPSLEALSP